MLIGKEENRKKLVWENIKRLLKIQLMQNYRFYFAVVLLQFGCIVCDIVLDFTGMRKGGGLRFYEIGHMSVIGTLLFFGFLCLQTYNSFCNDKISMYPGTRQSRYFSRVILDHLVMAGYVAYMAVLYFVVAGVYQVIHQIIPTVRTEYLFSWKYLFAGCIQLLFWGMMVYGSVMLIYNFMAWLGVRSYILVCIILFGIAVFGMTGVQRIYLPFVFHQYPKIASGMQVLALEILIWAVALIFSSLLILLSRKQFGILRMAPTILVGTMLIFSIGLGWKITNVQVVADNDEYGGWYEGRRDLEDRGYQNMQYRDFVLAYPENTRMKFFENYSSGNFILFEGDNENYRYAITPFVTVCSADEMKQRDSSFDETQVTKDAFVLRLAGSKVEYNGRPLYQKILDGLSLKEKQGMLYYDIADSLYSFNHIFGNAYYLAGMSKVNMTEWMYNVMDGIANLDIVVDEETMQEWINFQKEQND